MLGSLMPSAGHMVHMPAHIYLRVGRYADAAEANIRAIAADEDYLAQCQAQGLYPVTYYPHNLHFLWAAATLEGRGGGVGRCGAAGCREGAASSRRRARVDGGFSGDAVAGLRPVRDVGGDADGAEAARDRTVRDRHLALRPRPWRSSPRVSSIAPKRNSPRSNRIKTHEAFRTTLKDTPLLGNLQIASRIVGGELARARGQVDDAVRILEEAVALEDAIPYNEPPVWHHPVRQVLGGVLLDAGRARQAETVYRADLARVRENGWSLFGLMRSLEAQQRTADAADVRRRFERAWKRADITLASSRMIADDRGGLSRRPPG